jgi:murein L,D-transpeptidase YafK
MTTLRGGTSTQLVQENIQERCEPRQLAQKLAYAVLALACLGSAVGCSTTPSADSSGRKADRIVITKSQHIMTLFADGKALKTYKVALGRSTGAKQRQGDHKTPVGQYVIDQKNSQSRFHLALHVSYPNADDIKRAREAKADPGGLIMIHGIPDRFGWLGSLQNKLDWTDGCIAVTNPEIEEVWKLVPVGTPVEIQP